MAATLATVVSLAFLAIACDTGAGNGGPTPSEVVRIDVTVIGDGRVIAFDPGLNCAGTCTLEVPLGSDVALSAMPTTQTVLVAWEGPCSPFGGNCAWTATEDVAVTARFAPHALRFDLRGDGEGVFEIDVAGDKTRCDEACGVALQDPLAATILYLPEGTTRTVLGAWSGPCEIEEPNYCLVNVSGATTIGKTWRHPPEAADHVYRTDQEMRLEVASPGVLADVDDTPGDTHTASVVSGPANGTLELDDDGSFAYQPAAGFSGTDSFTFRVTDAFGNSDTGTATVTVLPRLTVTTTGAGTVTSVPEGIACDAACDTDIAHFDPGTLVTLTAAPDAGHDFEGWVDGPCQGSDELTCTVTMSAPVDVAAAFGATTFTLDVVTAGDGSGDVTSDPPGIDLGAGQTTFAFTTGTTITLTAEPDADSTFTSWTEGICDGPATEPTCTFTIEDDTTLTATFEPEDTDEV